VRLFAEPLQFAEGNLVLTPGFRPAIDLDVLKANEIAREQFSTAKFQGSALASTPQEVR
jgi:hypothetical protein